MKKAAWFVALIFATATMLAGNAMADEKMEREKAGAAQSDTQKDSQSQAQSQQQQQTMRMLDDLEGLTVQNTQGEKLGEISEVLVDVEAGQLGYAVVSSGGILGMGEDKYIVPFKALKTGEGESLLLDIPADRFKQAPQGQVEQAFSQEQGEQIHQFYGISPYWEESGAQAEQEQPDSQSDQLQQREDMQEKQ